MKTHEEIKKGLAACSADECHGQHVGCAYQDQLFCTMQMCGDALAYIEQLESTYSKVSKALCGKENAALDEALMAVSQLKGRLAQAERERDAAVFDLHGHCDYCKTGKNDCAKCVYYHYFHIEEPVEDLWQWRGVCKENSK